MESNGQGPVRLSRLLLNQIFSHQRRLIYHGIIQPKQKPDVLKQISL